MESGSIIEDEALAAGEAVATPAAASAGAAADGPAPDDRRRWFVLAVVLLAQLMLVLDSTVVNVALPQVQSDLHLDPAQLTWVNNSYLVALGGLLLLFGRLGDLVGRRRTFLWGLGAFTVASVACGLAQGGAALIVARFVQGAGAASASSVVLALIAIEFPDVAARSRAMSGYMFVSVGGGSLGLLVGGALTELLDWHWIFLINVPIGIGAVLAGRRLLHEGAVPGIGDGIDVAGAVLVTGSTMLGIAGIVDSASHGWGSARVVGALAAAVVGLVAFLVVESRRANALLPLRMLRVRSLMRTNLVRSTLIAGMFATFFFQTLRFAAVEGWGPFRIGVAFLPMTLFVAALSVGPSARLVGRFGAWRVLLFGLVVATGAIAWLATFDASTHYWPQVFGVFALFGLGAGTSFLPMLTLAMGDVPPADAGIGSALVSFTLQMSGAVAVAVFSTIAVHHTRHLVASGHDRASALVGGYEFVYAIAAALLAFGVLATVTLLRPYREAGKLARDTR